MRTITPFVLLAAAAALMCGLIWNWRQPAPETPIQKPVVARGALLRELTDLVNALGDEPAQYRANTPHRGFDAVQIGRDMSGDPVIAQVVYREVGGKRDPVSVLLVSERLVVRIAADGDCTSTAGRPLALCAVLSRAEWRQVFLQVASFARMACVAPGPQDCAPE